MDSIYNSSSNKIPYDDKPIFRQTIKGHQRRMKIPKLFTIMFVALFVMNIALCVTCAVYLKNGKIKNINIYNDTYSSQEVTYLKESMRSAKYNSVCVAAGLVNSDSNISGDLTNAQFYGSTKSHGAGFLYKIEGDSAYFVTCFHVIDFNDSESYAQSTRIWVLPASRLVPIEVELVAYSAKDDVAVLRYTHDDVLQELEGCTPVKVYDSTFITEYEDVFTIGNPLNHGFNGTQGKITSYRQMVKINGMADDFTWIKTNTAINPGNSGGALYNSRGEMIGMVNANIPKNTAGDPVSNIAFAIPGTLVCSIADYIIENDLKFSNPQAVDLGLELAVDEQMGVDRYKDKYKDQYGNYVDIDQSHVIVNKFTSASSIANHKDGLKIGDRLLSVELELYGKDNTVVVPILNVYTFYEYAYGIVPGSFMTFKVERQNEKNETIQIDIVVRATNRSYN